MSIVDHGTGNVQLKKCPNQLPLESVLLKLMPIYKRHWATISLVILGDPGILTSTPNLTPYQNPSEVVYYESTR